MKPEEVRLKVFLERDGALTIPTLYGLFRGADWQERETFDMYGISFEGHPHPKRLLMPEDWKGYPAAQGLRAARFLRDAGRLLSGISLAH